MSNGAHRDIVHLHADGVRVDVSRLGAELQSLRGSDGVEYIWSAGPQWPRHAPLLFPFICRQPDDRFTVDGVEYAATHHGFARDVVFDVVECSVDSALMVLTSNPWTLRRFPYRFTLDVEFRISGGRLTVDFAVTNGGSTPMPFALGWHPALVWPLDASAERDGHIIEFERSEPHPTRVVVDGFLVPERRPTVVEHDRLRLSDMHFADGAVIFDQVESSRLTYRSGTGRHLDISWTGFDTCALWSPQGADFLCIEQWKGLPASADAGTLTTRPELTHLDPAATASFSIQIDVNHGRIT